MQSLIQQLVRQAGEIIVGKETQIRLALACVLARGHLLIEDLPGVGKTTLAHLLAKLLGLQFNRVQFTSDLLPADILGAAVYERDTGRFHFQPGAIFTQVLLADEINRATPKTQSALLEAMEEQQVTTEGETRKLPDPFFVIATQNPAHHIGTFPLPESQLDRFLMRIELGYPDHQTERKILRGRDRRTLIEELQPCIELDELRGLREQVTAIHASDALLDYLQALVERSRSQARFGFGLSPRASLALLRSAQAWALMDNRRHVLPEDVQAVLVPVVSHRLQSGSAMNEQDAVDPATELLETVPIP